VSIHRREIPEHEPAFNSAPQLRHAISLIGRAKVALRAEKTVYCASQFGQLRETHSEVGFPVQLMTA
jgi:hypothetical protein